MDSSSIGCNRALIFSLEPICSIWQLPSFFTADVGNWGWGWGATVRVADDETRGWETRRGETELNGHGINFVTKYKVLDYILEASRMPCNGCRCRSAAVHSHQRSRWSWWCSVGLGNVAAVLWQTLCVHSNVAGIGMLHQLRAMSSKWKLSSYSSQRIPCTVDHDGIASLGKSTPCHCIFLISMARHSVTPGFSIALPISLRSCSWRATDFESSHWAVWMKFMARKSLHIWAESADMACISALHSMAKWAWSQVFKKLIIFFWFVGVTNNAGSGNAYNFGWGSRMWSCDWSIAFNASAHTGIAGRRRGLSGSENLSHPAVTVALFLQDSCTN